MVKRGEPQLGTGANQQSEWTPRFTARFIESASPAPRASQGLAPLFRAATGLSKTLGHGAVPTFFWGGEATRALTNAPVKGLNQMGVWRDSDRSQ
jgi:hypothetical protein